MSNNYVPIYNFTNLFHRDILLYAIGDWRLGAPLSMRRVGYTAFFAAIWIVPIVYIFGFHMNPYFLFLLALPPFYLGGAASKPIWGGRGFMEFITVNISYALSPKTWSDLRATDNISDSGEGFDVDYSVWISRRREMRMLTDKINEGLIPLVSDDDSDDSSDSINDFDSVDDENLWDEVEDEEPEVMMEVAR